MKRKRFLKRAVSALTALAFSVSTVTSVTVSGMEQGDFVSDEGQSVVTETEPVSEKITFYAEGISKAVEKIDDDGNMYYIILDTAIDNPDILRELKRLKRSVFGKNNIRIIKIHLFEFALLSFKFLEQWVFAEKDELRDKRQKVLEARNIFINIINNGADSDILTLFARSPLPLREGMNCV